MIYRCPTCKGRVKRPSSKGGKQGQFFPFCSERCKLIDLGGWFDEAYKISAPIEQKKEPDQDDDSEEGLTDG